LRPYSAEWAAARLRTNCGTAARRQGAGNASRNWVPAAARASRMKLGGLTWINTGSAVRLHCFPRCLQFCCSGILHRTSRHEDSTNCAPVLLRVGSGHNVRDCCSKAPDESCSDGSASHCPAARRYGRPPVVSDREAGPVWSQQPQ